MDELMLRAKALQTCHPDGYIQLGNPFLNGTQWQVWVTCLSCGNAWVLNISDAEHIDLLSRR